MGMLMEATVPTSHRWIPKAMNVQYLVEGDGPRCAHRPGWTRRTSRRSPTAHEIVVPVSVIDKAGTEVVHADITCWVTPA